MIKIETEKDGKINAAICGALDEIIPEFFSLLNHLAKICMDKCKDGKQEEFAAAGRAEFPGCLRRLHGRRAVLINSRPAAAGWLYSEH